MKYAACCSDEAYALYAAMALRSAALNTKGAEFHGFLFDCGITRRTRARCQHALDRSGISYTWRTVDTSSMKGLPTSTWVSPAGNVRLLLPNLLPDHIHRVLYLDSDVLVLSDITELWNSFDTNYAAAAAPDTPACPYVGCSKIADVITSYGLLESDRYFNSGVLLMNLKTWREEGIGKQVLDLIAGVGHQFTYVDQTALNIVLHAKWQVLDPAWNVTSSNFFEAEARVNTLLKKAKILHYTYENPGTKHCDHPAEGLFLSAVRESGYFSPLEYARWRFDMLRKRMRYQVNREFQTLRNQIAMRTRMKRAYNTILGRKHE